jgi:hypothetical protein
LVCKGCTATPNACKEYCKEFVQEKIGYRAWEWNSTKAEFEQLYITADKYLPLKHSYFHYQIWKAGADNAKRSHREWRKRKLEQALQARSSTTARKIEIAPPARYKGQRGNSAYTFMAGCENYHAMDPNAFANDQNCIRWALQLMDEKAGPWAI